MRPQEVEADGEGDAGDVVVEGDVGRGGGVGVGGGAGEGMAVVWVPCSSQGLFCRLPNLCGVQFSVS